MRNHCHGGQSGTHRIPGDQCHARTGERDHVVPVAAKTQFADCRPIAGGRVHGERTRLDMPEQTALEY
ncbi:hypothetical protein GR925_15135 [Streptomyces sp. HUCO-GS316]|uniref:hypothetical protein n=1 Tax=Streptomyces sp. HUCO-GS316 TaxID=2692198 RepID=UPI00136D7B6E|nr:hypothetical protein [Streptomyces sp. HUCO-GS316]MXM64742.1 hypothetical protein [Streptomyces sp. HUCO-GS316]